MPSFVKADRVQETSATTGTGTLTLAGAIAGFQSFLTAFGSAAAVTVYYTITDGTNWEVGRGTYTGAATTLSRDVVLSSSNSGALVNFTSGSVSVWCDAPAANYADMGVTVALAMRMVPP